jgi:predicted ester cyclase
MGTGGGDPIKAINLLERWFEEVWNQARESAIDEMASPDIVAHGLVDAQGQTVSSREKFREFYRQFRSAFPDLRVDVHDAMVDGDKVMVRCEAHGTHQGEGMNMRPTQKNVRFGGIIIARVRNNQLAEVWETWDFLTLYQQLGAVNFAST